MARQPMPKALSPLQSDQRSYTSEFSGVVGELVSKGRKEGNQEFAGYQGCSGYDGCGIVVIFSVVSCKTEGVRRDSVALYFECTIVINPIVNPIPVYGH
jgi:hypothetical protein